MALDIQQRKTKHRDPSNAPGAEIESHLNFTDTQP